MSDAGSGGGDSSFHNKSFQNSNIGNKKQQKKVDKNKKVLPNNKKFPELKLIINGEGRNSNQTFSSDDDGSSSLPPIKKMMNSGLPNENFQKNINKNHPPK